MLRGLTLAEAEERLDPGRPRKEGRHGAEGVTADRHS